VTTLAVQRGATVLPGDLLFSLDDQSERAAVAEAKARLDQARFQRDNLLTGKRKMEIRAIEAQREQAEADRKLSAVQLHRQEELFKSGFAAQSTLDNARAVADRDRARTAELNATLETAREGSRTAEISAADAGVGASEAAFEQAEWRLSQRSAEAPKGGTIEDVFFRPGEEVASGQPVVSLLPPDNVRVRFFLGPSDLAKVSTGESFQIVCQGCPPDLRVKVSFIASEASYAPPVIYSRENSEKLVFLVEARPTVPSDRLHPGQPVSLILTKPGAK
jgi:HlyD family secretion protein